MEIFNNQVIIGFKKDLERVSCKKKAEMELARNAEREQSETESLPSEIGETWLYFLPNQQVSMSRIPITSGKKM